MKQLASRITKRRCKVAETIRAWINGRNSSRVTVPELCVLNALSFHEVVLDRYREGWVTTTHGQDMTSSDKILPWPQNEILLTSSFY